MSAWFSSYGFGEVYPDLVVGAYPLDAVDVAALVQLGIDRVLNLVEDSEYQPGDRAPIEAAYAAAGIAETRMGLVDFGRLPPERIEAAVSTLAGWLADGQRVYVHCRAGWQRSAGVAAGTVAVLRQLDIEDALAEVQRRKPTADPLPHQRADLAAWWSQRPERQAG
jgi:atypical dual specificity phosphatase